MTQFACCLLLLPLVANAQDDSVVSQNRVVSLEVTILELSGDVKVADVENLDMEKLLQAVRSTGVFQHLTRVKLSTLELQKAIVQFGETQMVTSGRAQMFGRSSAGPRVATSYRAEETGTLVSATPRITENGDILIELQIEKSRLKPAPAAESDDETPTPPPKATLTLETTVKVSDGQSMLISGAQTADAKTDQLRTYVMVRATISN
jgi:type II secretory pathway component GspD/PulD (secretin)